MTFKEKESSKAISACSFSYQIIEKQLCAPFELSQKGSGRLNESI